MTAGKVIRALKAAPSDKITLRINSDGGEVFDAIALYNYLKDLDVSVIIDGICASAASIVAMAGSHIIMKSGSMMMIHNPVTLAFGDAEDLKASAEILDKITQSIATIYEAQTSLLSHDEIIDLMNQETWLNAEEAYKMGFIDEIDDAPEPEPDNSALEEIAEAHNRSIILAERERLKELDTLMAPGREEIINRAKYETGQSASDIAMELLKSETHARARKPEKQEITLNLLATEDTFARECEHIGEIIKRIRG